MANPQQFERNLGRVGARVAENTDRLVRKVAVAATQVVIVATPVDTGRARSNWLASLDEPREEQIEPLADGPAATQPAITAAQGVIRSYDGDSSRSIHLTNTLAYIERLNDGYSAQAPAGFVRLGLQAAVQAVPGARLLDEGGV